MANPGLGLGHMGHLGYTGPPLAPNSAAGPRAGQRRQQWLCQPSGLVRRRLCSIQRLWTFQPLGWNLMKFRGVNYGELWNPTMGTVKKACSAWKPSLSGLLVLGLCHNIHCFYRVTQLPISQVLVPFEASILGGSDEGPLLSSPPIYDRFKW